MIEDLIEKTERQDLKNANLAFKKYFLNDTSESVASYRQIVAEVADAISNQIQEQQQPFSGKSPASLKEAVAAINLFPKFGLPLTDVLQQTRELVIESNISVYHPNCLAHLHCPTFIASLAAEMIISAFNQSMDSWDQVPAATMIEQALCDRLCEFYGFKKGSDATFTGGGTMSNFMGLLLARDSFSQKHFDWNIQQQGLPPQASKFRIICSEHAHFSISQSASILGLGQNAVVKINHEGFNEEIASLDSAIQQLLKDGLLPIAYVTTAGTTDFGTIADIDELAKCAQRYGLWMHVDAAYGGASMFSEKHKYKLKGVNHADSVTIDFHKLFYQPVSCGVFMVKDKSSFDFIRLHADYLNPESNEELGILDLVYKSIQTTRRFDALKPFIALQHIGIEKFGEMLDYTIELASEVSEIINNHNRFELAYKTPINAVVFRYLPEQPLAGDQVDNLNNTIKTNTLLSGKAIIGQTVVKNRAYLKFTLLNPATSIEDVKALLAETAEHGILLEKQLLNVEATAE